VLGEGIKLCGFNLNWSMASNESGGVIHAATVGFPERAVTATNPKTTLTNLMPMAFLVSNAKDPPTICLASQIINPTINSYG
jgi:hypothetical protein